MVSKVGYTVDLNVFIKTSAAQKFVGREKDLLAT